MGQHRFRDAALFAPGLSWLLVFFLAPLAVIFVVSLATRDQYGGVLFEGFGLQNYRRALEPDFLPTAVNS
ncbi:MAG: hypothetical protein MUQ32_08025, partial [Chloroflexi bacterium]|nr:hypothetical protein [Chloroflexota bacterium]